MRSLALAAVGLAAAVLAAALLAGSPAPPRPLLPDLDQAMPTDVSIRRVDGRSLLVFASAVDNVGRGPLVIEGSRPDDSQRAMTTYQAIGRSDGSHVYRALGRLLWYERAATHSHWHLHRFARYELRAASGRVIRSRKAGFCLGDRYETHPRRRLPGEPAAAVWTHSCGRGSPGLLTLGEGISVGYGDDYPPYLEGQSVDVTRLPAGRYVLVHVANPGRLLREAGYANNASSVLLQLRRRSSGAVPTVRILRRCPATATCTAR